MASKSEIKKEVKIALSEIGNIVPWFDKEFNAWIFSNPLYPVECEGQSAEEVKKKYPKYLEVFIEHRMLGKIDEINEKKTKGKGGARLGAGRPKKEVKTITKTIRLSENLYETALWLRKHPEALPEIQKIMRKYA